MFLKCSRFGPSAWGQMEGQHGAAIQVAAEQR